MEWWSIGLRPWRFAALAAITPSLHHSITPSLHHSTTPSLHHSITPSLHHSTTPSLHHSITPPLHHSITPASSDTSAYGRWRGWSRCRMRRLARRTGGWPGRRTSPQGWRSIRPP